MATATNLPASFSSGAVLTAAQMNDLRGAFRVLQVVSANYSTQTNNVTNVYADTGLSATITPQATSSKILVYVSQNSMYKYGDAASGCWLRLLRGATTLNQFALNWGYDATVTEMIHGSSVYIYLDSPNTTSATTYKTQFRNNPNAAGINVQHDNMPSSIVLMEISA